MHAGSHWIVGICVELRNALLALRRLPSSSGPCTAAQMLRAAQDCMAETRCCTHNQQQDVATVKQEESLAAWLRVLDETEVLEGYGCSAEVGVGRSSASYLDAEAEVKAQLACLSELRAALATRPAPKEDLRPLPLVQALS